MVDGEPKPTSKGSLIEADFTGEEMTGPILVNGPTNTDTLRKLEPILKPIYGVGVQPTHLLEGMKSPNLLRSRNSCISHL